MDSLRESKYYKFIERAPIWLAISGLVIALGIVFMVINQITTGSMFNLSIHFTGGQKIILRLANEVELDGQKATEIVKSYSQGSPIVQVDLNDPHVVTIRMRVATEATTGQAASSALAETLLKVRMDLGNAYGGYRPASDGDPNPVTLEEANVGPTVRAELVRNAIIALIIGSVLIMIYILARFGRWQMSLAAVAALIHDVTVTLGATAILRLEVSDSFIAVILTLIGYSINDTIIIFDRIRENLRKYGNDAPLVQVCNLSLSQTVFRSVVTVVTVIIMILALIFLGGSNIRDFMIAMLIGNIAGSYSSVFIATPLMIALSKGNLRVEAETGTGLSFTPTAPDFSVPEAELDEPELEDEDSSAGGASSKRRAGGKLKRRR